MFQWKEPVKLVIQTAATVLPIQQTVGWMEQWIWMGTVHLTLKNHSRVWPRQDEQGIGRILIKTLNKVVNCDMKLFLKGQGHNTLNQYILHHVYRSTHGFCIIPSIADEHCQNIVLVWPVEDTQTFRTQVTVAHTLILLLYSPYCLLLSAHALTIIWFSRCWFHR